MFEEAEPYIQLGSFPTAYDLKLDFDRKLLNFPFYVKGKSVEYVKLDFAKGLTKAQIRDYCAAFSNEFVPAENSQVHILYGFVFKNNPPIFYIFYRVNCPN